MILFLTLRTESTVVPLADVCQDILFFPFGLTSLAFIQFGSTRCYVFSTRVYLYLGSKTKIFYLHMWSPFILVAPNVTLKRASKLKILTSSLSFERNQSLLFKTFPLIFKIVFHFDTE